MMKKIYLIDDNSKNQRAEFGASFVDEGAFDDVLVHIEKVNSSTDFSCLSNAACIMMHYSLEDYINGTFDKDSHKAKERIDSIIEDIKISNVSFSDGHDVHADWREESPNVIYSIKKSEFYLNLQDFLESYRANNVLDLRIIAYGKYFVQKLISRWSQQVIQPLDSIDDSTIMTLNMVVDRKALQNIIENAQPKVEKSFDELMGNIEDGKITIGNYISNINNIVSSITKYGENISSWT